MLPIPSYRKYAYFLWDALPQRFPTVYRSSTYFPSILAVSRCAPPARSEVLFCIHHSQHLCWQIFSFHIPRSLQKYFIAVLICDSLINNRDVKCIFMFVSHLCFFFCEFHFKILVHFIFRAVSISVLFTGLINFYIL